MILLKEGKDWFENYSKAGKEATKFNKILIDAKKSLTKNPQKRKMVNNCLEISAFESLEKKKEESIAKALNKDNNIFDNPGNIKRK